MNKRIEELAEQAGLPVIDGMWDYNDREILCRENGEWRVATPVEIISVLFECEKGREKFAELIVEECIVIMNREIDEEESKEKNRTISDMMDLLEKHFGVEE